MGHKQPAPHHAPQIVAEESSAHAVSRTADGPEQAFFDLQGAVGNRSTERLAHHGLVRRGLIQPKLRVGAPDDHFERQADRMAERVMGISDDHVAVGRSAEPSAQRMCSECEEEKARRMCSQCEEEKARRMCSECEEEEKEHGDQLLQPKAKPGPDRTEGAGLDAHMSRLRGAGKPLPPSTRAFFEPRFGQDFSAVRGHDGSAANAASRSIRARAFTVGRDVVFGAGEYAPNNNGGRRLLAHELTHVVQQTPRTARRKPSIQSETGDTTEGRSQDRRSKNQDTEPASALNGAQDTRTSDAPIAPGTMAPGSSLIVDDNAAAMHVLRPGQMKKSAFLAELRSSVCTVAEESFAGTEHSTRGCPWIEAALRFYGRRSADRLERDMAEYVPEAEGVATARDYIPFVAARVRRSTDVWVETGQVTGLPPGLPGLGLAGALAGSMFSGIAGLFFKAKEGGPQETAQPRAIQARLGAGSDLAGHVRRPMEAAFGRSFSDVRVHRDAQAARLAGRFQARAFTVGPHVAFGAGEYRPGTLPGDALIAHELAHVAQQDNAVAAGGRPSSRGGASSKALEANADQAAAAAVASSRPGLTAQTIPHLSSGLQLQRCSSTAPKPTELPSTMPAHDPTDFQINRVGKSKTSRLYFARGSSKPEPAMISKIKSTVLGTVRIIAYASADESPNLAQERADKVRDALQAPPNPITVTSALGNAAATANQSNFKQVRSAEVLTAGKQPETLDCAAKDVHGNLINPPKQPCPAMDPDTWTAFNDALVVAKDAMTRAETAVKGAPKAADAAVIDQFFSNHEAATLTTLRSHLANLKKHVGNLPKITQCGSRCDSGGCEKGSIAYNNGVDAASKMTLCVPRFKTMNLNDRARNLIHESAHGTSPLGGKSNKGTRDLAYRHERLFYKLKPDDQLRNSDSYALFAMYLREVQQTGNPGAVPAGISTPATDQISGFAGGEEEALSLAIMHLEKRLTWSRSWVGQLFGQIQKIRAGKLTWTTSWADKLMAQAAARFPLTPPPTPPTLTDQNLVAGILDRYKRMTSAAKRSLIITRMAKGVVYWPAASTWIAGNTLQVGPDFFRATPDDQIGLLLEHLAKATRDVEPAFIPAYVSLAEWIHSQKT